MQSVTLQKFVTSKAEGRQYQATTVVCFSCSYENTFHHYIELSPEAKPSGSEAFLGGLTAGKVHGKCCCHPIRTANLPADHRQQRARDVSLEVAAESAEGSYREPEES